jgi:ribokinase
MIYHLRREAVDTRWVLRTPGSATGVIVTHKDHNSGSLSSVLYGANARLTVEDLRAVDFAAARVILMQLGIQMACVLEAARLGQAAGAQIILDPAPPIPLPDELYPLLSAIKPNMREAGAITGITPTDRESAREAARWLLKRGVGAAVVQGGDGNLLLSNEGEHWLPHLPIDAVDTTGAGDTFAAALALMCGQGHDWAAAGRFAQVAAALATTDYGAQTAMPHRQTVIEFMERGQ